MGLSVLSTRNSSAATSSSPPETERTPRVALVAREGASTVALRRELAEQGWDIVPVSGAERLFAVLGDLGADLVLLDTELCDRSPMEICGDIRATEAGRFLPVVLFSMEPRTDEVISQGLMAGADDFCVHTQRSQEFIARVRVQLRNKRVRDRLRRVRNERDHYKRAAKVDGLTGLLNRGSFDAVLSEAMSGESKFAILFLDVDLFKSINDRFGHDVGDDVLRKIAKRIENSARGNDRCGRYGGEEFVVLVAGADEKVAAAVAERHRMNIESLQVSSVGEKVTVSVGYAAFDPECPDLTRDALYRRADAALYRAKRAGRNRIERANNIGESLAAPASRRESTLGGSNVVVLPATSSRIPGARSLSPITPLVSVSAPPVTMVPAQWEFTLHEEGAHTSRSPQQPLPIAEVEAALLRAMNKRAGLPILPEAAAQALRLARDPKSDMPRIARLVDRDPTLAARFISISNSPLYSAGSRVVSTHNALVRLGLATARDLLLQVVYERSHGGGGRFHREVAHVFARSVMAAVATQELARCLQMPFEDAYLCGLLHDIGEARIWRVLGEMHGVENAEEVAVLVARHHARAGAEVARAWALPSEVAEACEEHHDPPRRVNDRIRLVMVADIIAETATRKTSGRSPSLKFTPEELTQLELLAIDLKVATVVLQGVFVAGRMVTSC